MGRWRRRLDLEGVPLLLPGEHSGIRAAFDMLMQGASVRPRILAEVDVRAMLRLLARETGVLALVPPVVVADELTSLPGAEEVTALVALAHQAER